MDHLELRLHSTFAHPAVLTPSRSTGKERDAESGLDYFGARYYASNMGRWMSPDWADKPEAVPYSQLDNPQSLNLYGYVNNKPLSKADKDGHCAEDFCIVEGAATAYFAGAAVIAGTAAVLSTPAGQRSLETFTSAAGASFSSSFHSLTSLFSKGSKAAPAPAAEGEKTNTGPKAATAPGITAGGQATNEHGQTLGPSGKPQVNNVESNTREGAKNAGNKGSGTVEHPNPQEGDPHFRTTRGDGTKVQDSTHYNYPK